MFSNSFLHFVGDRTINDCTCISTSDYFDPFNGFLKVSPFTMRAALIGTTIKSV